MFTSLLNTEITIQERTNTGSDFKPVYTWSTYKTLKALKYKLNEREQPRNEGNTVMADYRFYTEYSSGVTNVMRVKHGTDYYNIYNVNDPNEMNRHLEINCKLQPDGVSNED